ncbi:tetratricopeptide repeat protein [Nostoc piscinale]|uniref:tetratricopeptide repeat protein n=1 Tax=Nostoc piscinale TaxID=224012 RepID=UPI001F1A864E|nr:tetratricopeptide repeat protein [Nostoc piscinale]
MGKSSLAARLCTRVQAQRPNFERVVLIGVVDEVGLINKLASKYERFAGVPALLNQPGISFKGRLQNFFEAIEDEHDKPVLLVLDDFEQNIPQENVADGSLRMTTAAYDVLAALCAALAENQAESRLIVTCRYLEENTLPPHRLHLESLVKMGEADINKIYWQLDGDVRLQVKKQRLLRIADGNPRLLKWLVEVVQLPDVAEEELLTKLEGVQLKFRENILAATLLDALEDEEKKFLAQLSVFRLPVTEDVINSLSPLLPTPHSPLPKLTSLSLVESGTTYAKQTPEYRVTTILAPLLQPLLTEEEWQTTQKAATRIIYRSWWKEADNKNEEQAREIVRLAVLAQEKDIAVSVGDNIANNWVNSSRYVEARELCQEILELSEDYRILGTIARAEETLGFVKSAMTHYEQALELCPEDDTQEKAATLHNMAGLKAQQGDVAGAIALYQQSLDIKESINDVQGKAATLHNMAGLKAQQGDVVGAIALYQQSLDITDSINNVRGKAATLHQMAGLKAQQGDVVGAIALYQQSLDITDSINDVQGKAATLHQMAGLKAQQGDVVGAIALYQQSLDIKESINDVQGKAMTLMNMAYCEGERGNKAKQLELNLQAAQLLGQVRAYIDLRTVLSNLGLTVESNGIIYLAQAVWLCLLVQVPLDDTVNTLWYMYNSVPQGDEMEALLGAVAMYFCQVGGDQHPQLEELQQRSFKILAGAAAAQGIETLEALATWFVQQRLNDPDYFIPRLVQLLEAIVGDEWLFERF